MTSEEAKEGYRAAWSGWCLAQDQQAKRIFEETMDKLQHFIAKGPKDPPGVWADFKATLPGYDEVWQQMASKAKTTCLKMTPLV